MEQRDYLLKEIEKIGILLRAIRNKLLGESENLSISIDKQLEETKEMLLNTINFDLNTFLSLNNEDSISYMSFFNGFNSDNIELLAQIFSQMGFNNIADSCSKVYLEKTLYLYELCILIDNTYSFEREENINKLKKVLSKHSI